VRWRGGGGGTVGSPGRIMTARRRSSSVGTRDAAPDTTEENRRRKRPDWFRSSSGEGHAERLTSQSGVCVDSIDKLCKSCLPLSQPNYGYGHTLRKHQAIPLKHHRNQTFPQNATEYQMLHSRKPTANKLSETTRVTVRLTTKESQNSEKKEVCCQIV
jgi:hypothetical protein